MPGIDPGVFNFDIGNIKIDEAPDDKDYVTKERAPKKKTKPKYKALQNDISRSVLSASQS